MVPAEDGTAAPLLLAVKTGKKAPAKTKGKEAKPGGKNEVPDEAPDDPDDDGEELEDEESEDESDDELEEDLIEAEKVSELDDLETAGDPALIEGFLGGDEECFVRLVTKYQNKVHNLCFRIMGDRDEAMDMAQEVFITVHKSLAGFRGDSLFSTWIFRVTVNHCKNRIKYLGRRRYYQTTSLDQPQAVGDGEVYFEVEDESPDPELTLASEEIQGVVQNAINSLDADHRAAVVLRDIQGLAYEEISEILGIKVGTVKSRIHRARGELKKKLEGRFRFKTKD